MSALTRYFFRNELDVPSTAQTIAWWEARRPTYNLVVGTAGVFTLSWMALMLKLVGGGFGDGFPIAAPLIYGIMANISYTLGWMIELWLKRLLGRNAATAGAALFRYGFAFSVGLTLMPAVMITLAVTSHFVFGVPR